MPDKACIDFENGYYHIYNRGVNKQSIFCDDEDRFYFIKLCGETIIKYDTVFLAFCLMGNHYHLFLNTPKANLSKIMKYIGERFSKYFIKKYKSLKKSGHTFMGPYGRRIVQDDLYANTLLSYIHNNPFKDRFVKHPCEYQWSSYNDYANRSDKFDFINKKILQENFSPVPKNNTGKAIIDHSILNWEPEDDTIGNLILGDKEFAKKIYDEHFKNRINQCNLTTFNRTQNSIRSSLMKEFINTLDLDTDIKSKIMIYCLLEWTELQSSELANEYKIKATSMRTVKHKVKKQIEQGSNIYWEISNEVKKHFELS